ncbi:MAG TPA: hypothetical protein VEV84_08250 [Pyrinomonadaceae bacterium]|nr:hypothetical protein [Pyrinomonadaceae bacterium]
MSIKCLELMHKHSFSAPKDCGLFQIFLFLLFVSTVSTTAFGQGGPPMITDDTETVPKGHFEINNAFTIERGADGTVYGVPLIDFNYGLNKRMQLKIEMPWVLLHNNGEPSINGPGNMNIGIRWRFRDETDKQRIALSIYPAIEFNTSQSSVRRGLVDKGPSFLLPLQWQTQVGKWGINGDVGYLFQRGQDQAIYGMVVGREVTKHLELIAEWHGEGPTNRINDHAEVYNLGTRIGMTKHTTFLFSAGSSLRRNFNPKFIMYTGIQVTF